ncbi:MAG: hypothetical protein LCI02_14800 [Proteobacteria bacterium]|nr:hypothetical protein [Pseudomonadota bacterium]
MPFVAARPRQPAAGAAPAQRFWEVAKQFASVAKAAANATPAALVEAGTRSRARQAKASELAAELATLSDKINEIRNRLAARDGKLVSARERDAAVAAMKRMVDEQELVASADFVQRRHITRQALSKALKAHRVFSVEVEGRRYLPHFFLDSRLERRQVEAVSQALGELPGASKLQFFTTRKGSLAGKTPLEALADGQYSRVRVAAQGFAER